MASLPTPLRARLAVAGRGARLGRLGSWTAAAVLLAALAACDDPSGTVAEDLLGIWGALEMVYTSDADPSTSVDLVNDAGATFSLELISGGTYRSQLHTLGSGSQTVTGTFSVSGGDRLVLTPSTGGDAMRYDFTFSQVFLTLVDTEAAYDFDGDGAAEPATLEMVLDRF